MSDDVLLVEIDGAVATLTLNRPGQYNALDDGLRRALRETPARLDAMDAVRVVILKGAGRGFCAGADLTAGRPSDEELDGLLDREYKPALMAIAKSPKIWIAQVHGTAAGIGAAFAMNCDLMTMADDASIYMAFAAIALVPDGGNTQLLLHNMGYHRAMAAILEGRKVPAAECHEVGIANHLFGADELDAKTREWADRLARGAPLAMAGAKRILRGVRHAEFGDVISMEGEVQSGLLRSRDHKEGGKAFFEKRKPVFEGH